MTTKQITANGTVPLDTSAYSKSTFYTEGNLSGASIDITCHNAILGTIVEGETATVLHGSGAPLKAVVSDASNPDFTLIAYPVK